VAAAAAAESSGIETGEIVKMRGRKQWRKSIVIIKSSGVFRIRRGAAAPHQLSNHHLGGIAESSGIREISGGWLLLLSIMAEGGVA